jgi:hypothetical protein
MSPSLNIRASMRKAIGPGPCSVKSISDRVVRPAKDMLHGQQFASSQGNRSISVALPSLRRLVACDPSRIP